VIIDRDVEAKADTGKMTLGELREFVSALDRAGAATSTVISGRVNWGGTVKSLKATAVRFGG
jgi:hypothetical protein